MCSRDDVIITFYCLRISARCSTCMRMDRICLCLLALADLQVTKLLQDDVIDLFFDTTAAAGKHADGGSGGGGAHGGGGKGGSEGRGSAALPLPPPVPHLAVDLCEVDSD